MGKRIGYCTNQNYNDTGKPCPFAESMKNQLLINSFATNCENCDKELKIEIEETPNKGSKKLKPFIITLVIAAIGIGLFFGIKFFMSGDSGKSEKDRQAFEQDSIRKADSLKIIVNQKLAEIREKQIADSLLNVEKEKNNDVNNSKFLTANTLNEYILKIADSNIDYTKKVNLKKEIITKYFSDENAMVVEIGKNNTEVDHKTIKEFVEELSQQYYKIKELSEKTIRNNNRKITTFYIEIL